MEGQINGVIFLFYITLAFCISSGIERSGLFLIQRNRTDSYLVKVNVSRDENSWNVYDFSESYQMSEFKNTVISNCATFVYGDLICTDIELRRMYRIHLEDPNVLPKISILKRGILSSIKTVYDSVHDVVYWFNDLLNKLIMTSLNTTTVHYTILMMTHITDFAITPTKGLIFFVMATDHFEIRRSTMLGKNQISIVYEGILQPVSLEVDEQQERIIWYDKLKMTIEYCSFNGDRRTAIASTTSSLIGIRFLKGNDIIAYSKTHVWSITVAPQNNKIDVLLDDLNLVSILVRQDMTGKGQECRDLRCEQYCITEENTIKCKCTNGFVLHEDGRHCLAPLGYIDQLVVILSERKVCFTTLEFLISELEYQSCQMSYGNVTFLTSDTLHRVVYFSTVSNGQSTVYSLHVDSKHLVNHLDHLPTINGLVYNTKKDTMYILTDNGLLARNSTTSVIQKDVYNARYLTLSDENQLLFWYNGRDAIIAFSPITGNISSLIAALNVLSMLYNNIDKRLYWTTDKGLWSTALDGCSLQVESIFEEHTYLLLQYQKIFYLKTGFTVKAYNWIEKKTAFELVDSENVTVDAVAVFDSDVTGQKEDICQDVEICEQICYIDNDESKKCSCRLGFRLKQDLHFCEKDIQEHSFFLVFDKAYHAFYQIHKETGHIAMIDGMAASEFDFDAHEMKIYFTKVNTSSISIFGMQGGECRHISTNGMFPKQIRYDNRRQMIIFAAFNGTTTNIYILKMSDHSTIRTIDHDVEATSIALSIADGFAFITRSHPRAEILSYNYQSMKKQEFFVPHLESPTEITVDEKEHEVYWLEEKKHAIYKSIISTQAHVTLVYYNESFLPVMLTLDENFVYILGRYERYIIQMKKNIVGSPLKVIPLSPLVGFLTTLEVYKKDFCPSIADNGKFIVNSNCTFLPDDVCKFTCEGNMTFSGSASCSKDKQWEPLDDSNDNTEFLCDEWIETTSLRETRTSTGTSLKTTTTTTAIKTTSKVTDNHERNNQETSVKSTTSEPFTETRTSVSSFRKISEESDRNDKETTKLNVLETTTMMMDGEEGGRDNMNKSTVGDLKDAAIDDGIIVLGVLFGVSLIANLVLIAVIISRRKSLLLRKQSKKSTESDTPESTNTPESPESTEMSLGCKESDNKKMWKDTYNELVIILLDHTGFELINLVIIYC